MLESGVQPSGLAVAVSSSPLTHTGRPRPGVRVPVTTQGRVWCRATASTPTGVGEAGVREAGGPGCAPACRPAAIWLPRNHAQKESVRGAAW